MQPFAARGEDASWGRAGAEDASLHTRERAARSSNSNAQMRAGDRFVFAQGLEGLSVVQVAADALVIQPTVARSADEGDEDEEEEDEEEEDVGEEDEGEDDGEEGEEEDEGEAAMQDVQGQGQGQGQGDAESARHAPGLAG